MQAIINFNDYADISSFKKILETFKGVKDYQILNDSDDEMRDEEFGENLIKILGHSSRQIDEGKGIKVTPEYLDSIFAKWK